MIAYDKPTIGGRYVNGRFVSIYASWKRFLIGFDYCKSTPKKNRTIKAVHLGFVAVVFGRNNKNDRAF